MTTSYVESGSGRIAVEVDGTGPLVVCSPAMGDIRSSFDSVAERLVAAGYRVARFDLRGHGDSSAHSDRYGDEATAEDFLSVLEHLGGKPAVLAGASLSAGAAVIAAARRPDLVRGLILLAPFLRNGLGRMGRRLLHLALARPWGPVVWRFYAGKLWPGLGTHAGERAAATTALLTRPGRWAAFHATTDTDHAVVAPWIGRVRAPVLVVMGDADPDWSEPLAEAQWVASNFADSEVVAVRGAGHAPMLERPDVVAPAMLGFLSRIGAADTPARPFG